MQLKVHHFMNPRVMFLQTRQTISDAAGLLRSNRISAAPVLNEQSQVAGIISQGDLLQALADGLLPDTPLDRVMSPPPEALHHDEDLLKIIEDEFDCLPIYKDNHLVGMLEHQDVLKKLNSTVEGKKAKIEATIDAVYNPVISIDKNYIIHVFNRSAARLLGIDAEKARGADARTILAGHEILDALLSGTHNPLPVNKLVIGNRSFLPYRTRVVEEDEVTGSVLVLREISEFEELVRESEYYKNLNRELDAIIESSFDGLYVTDGQANTLKLNKAFERVTGITAAECLGRNMADLVEEGVFSRSGTLLALEKKERVTISIVPRSGKQVLVTSNPIFDDKNNIVMVVTNARDITELNELHRKLEQVEGLRQFYKTELQNLRLQRSAKLITNSSKMKELLNMVLRVASVDSTVLIQGESGVGKELIAEIIHSNSNRKEGPFVKVNCGAIPQNLLESELFGYEEGAFTGASKGGKIGLFELAKDGILFLDEIGELPLNLQVKLLRVLQDKEINRVGGGQPIKVNTRILAGTNRDLVKMVAEQEFRADLYYRLNVIPINVPPLRERRDEIPALANYFLEMCNAKYHMQKRLHKSVMDCLLEYNWPGNVRELENLIERVVVTSGENIITVHDMPASFEMSVGQPEGDRKLLPLRQAVENAERQLLERAFSRYRSSYQVARVLEVNQSTVVRKAAKYGIKRG